MKNLFFTIIALYCGIIIFSCNKATDQNSQQNLQLKSPSGAVIASTTYDLKKIALETISGVSNLEITKVEYLNVKTGFAAIVSYKTNTGIDGNFALVRYPKIEYTAGKLEVKRASEKSGGTSQLQSGDITVTCNGTCGCTVSGTIKPDGTITFKCGCDNCTATVKGS